MKTTPFRIDVGQDILDDLLDRVRRTRWPDEAAGAGWSMGADVSFMKRMASHWVSSYDWRAHERELNQYAHLIAKVDSTDVHAVHVRGKGPNPIPLLLIHSFPDSFYRFHKVIPLLTDPASHGGDPSLSFDVVIPSLPGFGFSAHTPMSTDGYADTLAKLMAGLGYSRYIAGGGDGHIPIAMARRHPDALLGLYSVDVGYPDGSIDPSTLSAPEVEFANWIQGWWMREGAFNMIQSTKPQSLAVGMNDSPMGLAAWLMILFSSGSADPLERFTMDELITNAVIYWVTGTIGSAMRYYLEEARVRWGGPPTAKPERSRVPAAVARMPLDAPMPREWAQRQVNLVQFTEMARGGHYSSWEVPEAFAEDVRKFAGKVGREAAVDPRV